MKTNFLKSCYTAAKAKIFRSNPISARENLPSILRGEELVDSFVREDYGEKIVKSQCFPGARGIYNHIMGGCREFGAKEYENLTPQELEAIRGVVSVDTARTASMVVDVAKKVKSAFDKKYGEGNYVFAAIGRSCATIADCMKNMDAKTTMIPLSGLSGADVSYADSMACQFGFEKYKNFLYETLGNPKAIKHTSKKILFCDFSTSGSTLKVFDRLMSSKSVGYDRGSYKIVDFRKFLKKLPDDTSLRGSDNNAEWMWYKLLSQGMDDYSPIHSLDCSSLRKVDIVSKLPLSELAKQMQFCVQDILHLG